MGLGHRQERRSGGAARVGPLGATERTGMGRCSGMVRRSCGGRGRHGQTRRIPRWQTSPASL